MINKLEPVPGQYRALCCGCGEVRRFSRRYDGGNQVRETGLASERCTIDLKCAVCGKRTRHAYLLDFHSVPDIAERRNPPVAVRGYDPFREAAERWSTWDFTETLLPEGIIEIIDPDRREAYYDRSGWQGDQALALAHVLAHLDLRHYEVFEWVPSECLEMEAERVARERLDLD